MVKKEVSRSVDYISSDDPWGFEPGEFRGPARPIPHVADDGGGSWGRAGGGVGAAVSRPAQGKTG